VDNQKKRSPLREKPLRRAGQSVEEKIQGTRDKIDDYAFLVAMPIALAVYEWLRWYFKMQPQPIPLTIVAILYVFYALRKVADLRKKIHRLELGLEGETVVGQELESFRATGYRVFHDIVADGFNIDHVLIGSAGVFAVETKTISKPPDPTAKIVYDGETVTVAGFSPDRNPVTKARAEAAWLRKLIKKSTTKDVRVRPVVLYPGWYITPQPKGAEVWVLNPDALPAFIEHEDVVLSPEDINLVTLHLELYVRAKEK
jgi:hypothetical protein